MLKPCQHETLRDMISELLQKEPSLNAHHSLITSSFEAWVSTLFPQFSIAENHIALQEKLSGVSHVFFDFDGVLTDNKVYTDEHGNESVVCDRADGLGVKQLKQQGKQVYILSTEANSVVQMRAKKLGVACFNACEDKALFMRDWMQDNAVTAQQVAFIGNDINDLGVMAEVGLRLCPADSDASVLAAVDYVLARNGGDKVAREVASLFEKAIQSSQEHHS
ncbi:KdsC family phosphatase [Alteromonas sp. a30]|uniref:KdsC family phosphatase n=1 Tax=Alteromonas sp. a30 TaxID=2730917 RepID=UPI00227E5C8E|nr:HAD-IIIA family hydrolase [Alteromonas sp. a30]MCY7296220.1 HAD-IIIA family hydrolase [Alteromonas sp. a30]